MTDIVERLNDIWSDDDHERGCQGREYSCTCGFDDRTFAAAKDAATEITRLREACNVALGSLKSLGAEKGYAAEMLRNALGTAHDGETK